MGIHTPERMCVICGKRAPKAALLGFAKALDGAEPGPDHKQTAPGRGMYVCEETRCREAFSRRSAKRKAKGQEL